MKKALCAGVLAWWAFMPVARADDDVQAAPSQSEASSDDSATSSSATLEGYDRGPDDFGAVSEQGGAVDGPSSSDDSGGGDAPMDVGSASSD